MLTRRRFLIAAGAGLVTATYGPIRALAQAATQTITLEATATNLGQYLYLPFQVPAGTNRVAVKVTKRGGDAVTGAGLFDQRGAAYQTAGFRGIYGEERSEFFVTAAEASQAFIPGTIQPGEWTVVVPVFRVTRPTAVTATVTLSFGPQPAPFRPGPAPEVVRDQAGWYRGDLHCHTPESSDAWKSGSALTPTAWAGEARRVGLDFLAMTDHNVISQNFHLQQAAGTDVLLIAGEEMTNWFHGHATVTGIDVGDWLDWRQTPAGTPLPSGQTPGRTHARIQEFLGTVREMGAFVSAAHPLGAHLSWQFFADGDADPAARPDALEVWTGQFQPDDEASLRTFDERVRRGWRVWANGGSDLHGIKNTQGFAVGRPTTVVYAERLSKRAIVTALRAGRCFVTRRPDGVELYLTAAGPQEQRDFVGGTIYGGATDTVEVEVLVRRAPGMRLLLLRDGAPLSVTPITGDEQVVRASVQVGAGGAIRAEVRGVPEVDPTNPIAGRTDMEAFTNPILLVRGPVPDDARPQTAPPPERGGPSTAAPAPEGSGGSTPATGGGVALPIALGGVALALTLTELRLRATDPTLAGRRLRIVGQVTSAGPDRVRLTRWVPSCCAEHEAPVSVDVLGVTAEVGEWLEVDGELVPGTGAGGDVAVVRAHDARTPGAPVPRREA